MATAKGIAKISAIFDMYNGMPIDAEAYPLWLEVFADIDDADLRKAAMWLVETRSEYARGQVTTDEIVRELQSMGIYIHHRKKDPAFDAAIAARFPDGEGKSISLAEFRKTNEEGGEAVESYLKGEKDVA